MRRFIPLIMLASMAALAASSVLAQDISAEEMIQLDKYRAQYKAQGIDLKPEDEIRILQRLRALKAASSAQPPQPAQQVQQPQMPQGPLGAMQSPLIQQLLMQQGMAVNNPAPAPALQLSSEEEVQAKLNRLPPAPALSAVEYLPDGLSIMGRRFVDPEGKAERVSVDPDSALVAYMVQSGGGHLVKVARVGASSEPVILGRVDKDANGRLNFRSTSGKALGGDMFYPMLDGALILRDSVGFRYVAGEGVRQIDFPSGWYPAPLQRGNISGTGWILLERDTVEEKSNPLAAFKKIGQIAGALQGASDYALFNINDKRQISFEIDSDGKSVTKYSDCRRRNNFVNVCDQAKTYDSIWRPDGSPNVGHYFWKVEWQKVAGRSVAVVMEKSLQQVNAYDLAAGKKINLFQRMLGINWFRTEISPERKFRALAQLGFDKGAVEDVVGDLDTKPAVPKP